MVGPLSFFGEQRDVGPPALCVRRLLLEDTVGDLQNTGIVESDNTTIRTAFQVHTHWRTVGVAVTAEVIPNSFHGEVQLPCYSVDTPIWQVVLDPPKLVECDVHDG